MPSGIWTTSNGNRATRPAVKHLKSGLCPRGKKGLIEENSARTPRSFVFCEKLLGYFCDKDLRRFCWWFCPRWQKSGSPGGARARCFAHSKERGSDPVLWAVYGRFGPEYEQFGSSWTICAIYANGATPHKHWLFRILLIWRVGT